MPYKKLLHETAYGRGLDDRNDTKWAHPELAKWWVAGNADMVEMCCDDNIPVEKRLKRLNKIINSSTDFFKGKGFDPYAGTDWKDGGDYGVMKAFTTNGCPEAPDMRNEVLAVIPNEKADKPRPIIFMVLGGAFIMQKAGIYPEVLRWAKKFNAVLVTCEYTNIIEAQYPTQMNELHSAYQWMLDNAEMLGGDPDNVVLTGESTGAHLALCLAFRLKRYGITPRGCVVNDPMLEDRNMFVSNTIIKQPCDADRAHTMFVNYVGFENCGSSYTGPETFSNHATIEECKGLCPMFINIGESDQDRDSTLAFAEKLYAARVPASVHVWMGSAHATLWNASPEKSPMAGRFWDNLYGDLEACMKYDLRRPWAWDETEATTEEA